MLNPIPSDESSAAAENAAFSDLSRRLRSGERDVSRAMLSELPDADDEFAIDLIYREYLFLAESDEPPEVDSWCRQFPGLEQRLRRLLEVDREFNDGFGHLAQADTFDGRCPTDATLETNTELSPSRTMGRYQLLHQIGQGGSSRIYKATQIGLGRVVAVKLLDSMELDEHSHRRFRLEAELVAGLQHPGIVQLYDYGSDDGQLYLVLEYMPGGGLDKKSEVSLPVSEVCRLMIKIAGAIQYAHEQSIIHRDLKPSNILLTSGGEPKVADFGLAKKIGLASSDTATNAGATLGTPGFMAPEQIGGSMVQVGPAADVYGLGAILYQLLTSRPPFVAGDMLETLRLVRETDPVAPSRLRPGMPRDLEVICMKCLRKEPEKRFASAAELASDLQRFVNGIPIKSRAAGPIEKAARWCRRRPVVACLLVLLAVSILVGVGGIVLQWQETQLQASIAQKKQRQSDENYASAREAIDRLTDLSIELSTVPGTDGLREEALREVLSFYLKNVNETDEPDSALEAANTLIQIAAIRAELSNYAEAIDDLSNAQEILADLLQSDPGEHRYQIPLAKSHFKSGICHRVLGQMDQAVSSHLKAASIYEEVSTQAGSHEILILHAAALNNAAPVVAGNGDLKRAIGLSDQAIDLFARIDESKVDDLPLLLVNRAIVFETRANLLERQGRPKAAIDFLTRAVDDMELAVRKGLKRPAEIKYLARVHAALAGVQVRHGEPAEVWSVHTERAVEILRIRWKSRPDRPAIGSDYTLSAWRWAQHLWFAGDRQRAKQVYRDIIATLLDLNTRFPEFHQGSGANSDIITFRLCLLWATCPIAELRDPEAALKLARTSLKEQPDNLIFRSGATVAEALYGDTSTAEDLLAVDSHFDNSRSPEVVKHLVQLAIKHRRGKKLTDSDVEVLKKRRDSPLDHAGVARHLAETLVQMCLESE